MNKIPSIHKISGNFVHTNVFIYAFEYPESNSSKIIELLNEEDIEAVISERVLTEVMNYFKKYHNKDIASLFRLYLLESCILVLSEEVKEGKEKYEGEIKDKDLEQLAVVKQKKIKTLISYDRDFEPFEEYTTPKEFISNSGEEAEDTIY